MEICKQKSEIVMRRDLNIRGQSDKYLVSPPDGVTIAREIYYRI